MVSRELMFIDFVDEGIVVMGPSLKKFVAISGFSLEVKTLLIDGGNSFIVWVVE